MKTGCSYFFKNNRLLFSRNVYNLIIPEQGIEMQMFPKRVEQIIRKWHHPSGFDSTLEVCSKLKINLHFNCPIILSW